LEITKEVFEERGVSIDIDGGLTLEKGGTEYVGLSVFQHRRLVL